MEASLPCRILVVANLTAAAPPLLDWVRRRTAGGGVELSLLIPDIADRKAADWTLDVAVPVLERAARGKVRTVVCGEDAFAAIEDTVRRGEVDEIVISTLPPRMSRWLRRDLPHRVQRLGVPVTVITMRDQSREAAAPAAAAP